MLERLRRFREHLRISRVGGISRRYFVLNSFDGSLTMLGIIIGGYTAGVTDPRFVIGTGLGASFAMAVSGFSGAFMTERAERIGTLRRLRRAMLSDLRKSIHFEAAFSASLWAAIIDGLSPALAAAIPMVPYALALFKLITATEALYASVALILLSLFAIGAFLGTVSKESILFSGLKMIIVGAAVALILLGIGRF